ncbi:MAG: Ldh family oxidoreductase [bacterium]|nr:Ldh family oxidoreductase [bacterium]
MPENDLVRVSLEEVHQLARAALVVNGASTENADAVARTITAAERDDCKAHGLFRVPFYVKGLEDGKVNGTAVPETQDISPGLARVDAHRGYAPLAIQAGIERLVQKAKANGIAAVSIVNCYHVAALWPEVEWLAEQGLVSFAFTQYMAFVAPAGGTQRVYGTNPMAFGWPRDGAPPLVFDQASSASSRGDLLLHHRDGKPIPPGWAIDADGNPTSDPGEGLKGSQLPFGGYKGAALALMVELLAGALIGAPFSFEATETDPREDMPPLGGELIIAIDPTHFHADPQRPLGHSEKLFGRVLAQEGTRLPSERRYAARRESINNGILVPSAFYRTLQDMAAGG